MDKVLSFNRALDALHAGARMVMMYTAEGPTYYIVPGGPVRSDTAKKLADQPNVIAGKDALFPDHDQTWRIMRVQHGVHGEAL